MKITRRAIKRLVKKRLKTTQQKFKRIEVNRPNPLLLDSVPVILIYTDDEDITVNTGSKYIADTHERMLGIRVDVVCDAKNGADDLLDEAYEYIEDSLLGDIFLEKAAKVIDENDEGNCEMQGVILQSIKTYKIEASNERIFYGLSGLWVYVYKKDAIPDEGWADNSDYDYTRTDVKVNDRNKKGQVDETLIEARTEHNN